jgi:SAM-dependent methyltransferase
MLWKTAAVASLANRVSERVLAAARRRTHDLAVRAGLRPYSRRWLLSASDWDREYAGDGLHRYGELVELSRYSVLLGYIRYFGQQAVLDYGCGVGLLRARLRDDEIGRYVGVDPSSVAIERARAQEAPRSVFVVGTDPPAEHAPFDVVVCNEVIYYAEDVGVLLEQLHAVMRPGGYLLTSIFRHPGDIALHRLLDRRFVRRDAVHVQSQAGPRHAWNLFAHQRADSA